MNELQQSQEAYKKADLEIRVVSERINEREQQIIRLQKKQRKLEDNHHWTDDLIRPIMIMVKVEFPQLTWDDESLIPMGLCCRVSLFAEFEGKTIMICFTPSNIQQGIIACDTGEQENSFPNGSIGAANGMNNIRKDITDIEQVFNHIQKQLNQ